jgi:hypothetical protein
MHHSMNDFVRFPHTPHLTSLGWGARSRAMTRYCRHWRLMIYWLMSS